MITKIYIGDIELDLFDNENIEIVSSVLDIADISKNTTDYTKTFTVPASKSNNKLFKQYYNANIDNTFDARVKVAGRIELDGIPFKVGKFRLQKVEVKQGAPSAYTINFFGNITDISKTLKKDKLSDLDLSAYTHTYNDTNVKLGLTTFLSLGTPGDIIYNTFAKKQYYYDGVTAGTRTDALSNVAYIEGEDTGIEWNDLRPSIRLIRLIEAIETKYSLTFSRDFFGTSEFQNLYMWCNNDAKREFQGYSDKITWSSGSSVWMNTAGTGDGVYTTEYPDGGTPQGFRFSVEVTPSAGYEDVDHTVKMFVNGSEYARRENGDETRIFIYPNEGQASIDNDVYFEMHTEAPFVWSAKLTQSRINYVLNPALQTEITNDDLGVISGGFIVSDNMPELETIEFLKGLFSMFKLLIIPQIDGTFYVDTLASYYSQGTVYDVTKYVDFSAYDVNRGTLLNELSFKFEDPQSIVNIQFDKNNDRFYGNDEIKITDDGTQEGELLDGEALEVEIPFEQIVYERLRDVSDNSLTSVQYGAIIDENLEPVNPKAHIFYNTNISSALKGIGFIDSAGSQSLISSINIPSHTDPIEFGNYATVFKDEFSSWDGVRITNNLYSNHWSTYVLNLFNIKKREFSYKAILPLRILYNLGLNDVLKIKDNYYRIDKYTHNLLTGETQFNLVNSFDDTLNNLSVSSGLVVTNGKAKTISEIVTDLQNSTYAKIDTGDGTGWTTVTDSSNVISFDIDPVTSGSGRTMTVRITQTATGKTKDILIVQGSNRVSFDSNTITFDNDIITWDNRQ